MRGQRQRQGRQNPKGPNHNDAEPGQSQKPAFDRAGKRVIGSLQPADGRPEGLEPNPFIGALPALKEIAAVRSHARLGRHAAFLKGVVALP